jgi:hypothetical protein
MAYLLKDLTLSLDVDGPTGPLAPVMVECQLSKAELVDNPTTEDVTTFCGTETFSTPKYELNLGGFQDYGAIDAVADLLHTAYITPAPGNEIDFVLSLGKAPGVVSTRTGKAKPVGDIPFGGTAGSALTFDVTLSVVGTPIDG